MSNREKELRTKIAEECLQNNHKSEYDTACSECYDFIRCPDDFECLKDEMKNFLAICDDISLEYSCEECWKNFLRNEKY